MSLTASVQLNFLDTDKIVIGNNGEQLFFPSGSSITSNGIPPGGVTQSFDITCSVVSASNGLLQTNANDSGSYIAMPKGFGRTNIIWLLSSSLDLDADNTFINSPPGVSFETSSFNHFTASFRSSDQATDTAFAARLQSEISCAFWKSYGAVSKLAQAPLSESNNTGTSFTVHSRITGSYPVYYNQTLTSSFGFEFNWRNTGSGTPDGLGLPGTIIDMPEESASFKIGFDQSNSKSFFISGSTNGMVYISSSGKLGLGTTDPLTDIDLRANEFQVQRTTERRGIKVNAEGNIESFDRSSDTAATGSEFIIRYSRGTAVTEAMMEALTGDEFDNDSQAQARFNGLSLDEQASILKRAEELGFLEPAQAGDVLGSIRWVAESGSIGDYDDRTTGEAAVIKAVVDENDSTGTAADLIFSVAGKTGAAQQKLLLDANGDHQITGSLKTTGTIQNTGNIIATGYVSMSGDLRGRNTGGGHSDITGFDALSIFGNATLGNNGNETHIFRGNLTGSTTGTGGNIKARDINLSGNLTATNITATSLTVTNITSSNLTSSIIITSGSNIFGDGESDTHTFNGSITASADISASGDVTAVRIQGDGGNITGIRTVNITNYGRFTSVTSSGNISSSAGVVIAPQANFGHMRTDEIRGSSGTNIKLNGPVTASGDVSASGLITAFSSSTDHVLVNDKLQGNGSGFQFFAFNEDTSKVKFANWYTSTDNQYGMGMLWYETWFAAIDTDGDANDVNRRIGFYLEQPNSGSTDSVSGVTGAHPTNARFYVDVNGGYLSGSLTSSGDISSSGEIYSATKQYWSTTGRLVVGNNTTNYYGPNNQGVNYYYWNRDLGTSSTTITSKTQTMNSGFKLPYKAILTGYHLNIQGRSTTDNIKFTLVYSNAMFNKDVTSTSQTLAEAESEQTVTISAQNNFYELDRRGQFAIAVNPMTMIYPRFRKAAATGGTTYDFQLAVEYIIAK